MQLGRPIDSQKLDAMNQVYQLNVDRQVYVGSKLLSVQGLLNQGSVKNPKRPNRGNRVRPMKFARLSMPA
ncbi:hypothetical protein SODG_002879 [Sodalis praecaptivus]